MKNSGPLNGGEETLVTDEAGKAVVFNDFFSLAFTSRDCLGTEMIWGGEGRTTLGRGQKSCRVDRSWMYSKPGGWVGLT